MGKGEATKLALLIRDDFKTNLSKLLSLQNIITGKLKGIMNVTKIY